MVYDPNQDNSPNAIIPQAQQSGIGGIVPSPGANLPQGNVPIIPPQSFFQSPQVAPVQPTGNLSLPQFNTAEMGRLRQAGDIKGNQADSDIKTAEQVTAEKQRSDVEQQASLVKSQAAQEQAYKDAMSDFARRQADLAVLQKQQIDPNHYWATKSGWGKTLAAISMGLGAAASGLTKGATGNPGMIMINKAIDEDIEAQKSNITNNWTAFKEKNNLADTAFNRSMYESKMANDHRLNLLTLSNGRLDTIKASGAPDSIKNAAALTQLGVQSEVDKLRTQNGQLAATAAAGQVAKAEGLDKERSARIGELTKPGPNQMSVEEAIRSADQDPRFARLKGTAWQSQGQAKELANENIARLSAQKTIAESGRDWTPEEKSKLYTDELAKQHMANPAYGSVGGTQAEKANNEVQGLIDNVDVLNPSLSQLGTITGAGGKTYSRQERNVAQQEANAKIEALVAKAWKNDSSGRAPSPEAIHKVAEAFMIPVGTTAYEDRSTTLRRFQGLQNWLNEQSGKSAPNSVPSATSSNPQSITDSNGRQFVIKPLNGQNWLFDPKTNEPIAKYNGQGAESSPNAGAGGAPSYPGVSTFTPNKR